MSWFQNLLRQRRSFIAKEGIQPMTTILRIDASSRDLGSVSRQLGDYVERRLVACSPQPTTVLRRDLAAEPLPHIANATIAGYYTPADQMTDEIRAATALSDKLIAELLSADILLISVPMYNFSIPSALKSWIDHIVRIGHTFSYDGSNFTGLVANKKAYVVCAYGAGGYQPGAPFAVANFVEPYLQFLLHFLGVKDVTFLSVEATTAGADVVSANIAAAEQRADACIAMA